MTQSVGLFDILDEILEPYHSPCVLSMEEMDQNYGFALYRTEVNGPRESSMELIKMHDRALVYVNGQYKGTKYRNDSEKCMAIAFERDSNTMDILVENMGRVNYGPHLKDIKGISENVKLDYQFHFGFTIYPLPLDNIQIIKFGSKPVKKQDNKPVFYKGEFNAEETGDTFLLMDGWTKGVAYINGFNLGRYWNAGPQRTLYIPGPLHKKGKNEIVIFELHGCEKPVAKLIDKPVLG